MSVAKGAVKRVDAGDAEVASTAHTAGEGVAAVYLPVGALRPHPRNPRAHGPEVLNLARTIIRTTWGAPIVAQRATLRIIGGHGRLEAAREILAGIEVDGMLRGGADHRFDRDAPGPGMVPVRLVDVSDAEAEAMTLADNSRRLQGRDDPALVVEMATRSFERNAPLMLDMGLGADDLDRLVREGGDAVMRDAATAQASGGGEPGEYRGDPNGREFDESVEGEVPSLTCPHCGKLVPRGK